MVRKSHSGCSRARLFHCPPRVIFQHTKQDGFPFADISPDNFVQRRDFDIAEGGKDKWALYSLTTNYAASFGSFTSSTSYFDRNTPEHEDYSAFIQAIFGLGTPLPSRIDRQLKLKRFVQELRFASDFHGPFQVIAGAFYSFSRDYNDYLPASVITGLDSALGGGGTIGDLAYTTTRHLRTRERAVYGEASLALTDALKATVGIRYFINSQSYKERADGVIAGGPVMIDRPTATERGATPKFLLEYHADRDVMLYASAAKGYRVGGFNGDLSPTCDADLAAVGMTRAQTLKYNSDTLWNYELGAKTSFADRKVTANVAAFRIDWSDIQQNVLLSCGFPFIGNSGKARSTGFEIEINARPVRALELGLALGYTDAKITKAGNGTPQLKGSPVYQVPKWTAAVKAEYSAPLSSRFEGFVRGDYSFTDSSSSANNDPLNPRLRPSYSLLDARLGVRSDALEFALFGKNLADTHANLADNRSLAAEAPGLPRIVTNRPRTIGIEARYRF
jgi:iron complex outermembrane receptor protein